MTILRLKVVFCALVCALLITTYAHAQEKPKPEAAKPETSPSPLTLSKQQSERLQIADNIVMLKRNDLALAQMGREALEADTLAEMGLDIKVWAITFKDGKHEAVKREPAKPPAKNTQP